MVAEYQGLKLPKGKKKISIYIGDKQTGLKTENIETSDIFLTRLNLDNLGWANRALQYLGCLTTLYVAVTWSDVGSQISTMQ
jgi:hypothetical protein